MYYEKEHEEHRNDFMASSVNQNRGLLLLSYFQADASFWTPLKEASGPLRDFSIPVAGASLKACFSLICAICFTLE